MVNEVKVITNYMYTNVILLQLFPKASLYPQGDLKNPLAYDFTNSQSAPVKVHVKGGPIIG